jgi:hypothetical protein
MLKKIEFVRDRMIEKQIVSDHYEVFSKLRSMANTKERTSQEHIKLYNCYID